MRKLVLTGIVGLMTLLPATSASAITNGSVDGNLHPEVGAMLAQHARSDGTWTRCSGTLISSTVFLTAAHCEIPGVTHVNVTFDSAYVSPTGKTYGGTWHADPAYNQAQKDPHDIAVIVLDHPVRITPALLPGPGSLDGLGKNAQFTSVGYGTEAAVNGPGGQTFPIDDVRHYAVGTLNSITPSWLKISQNGATDNGGTCYGDSGGPNFLGAGASETNVIAATTITGDTPCRSTNVDYRLDTASARSFLDDYVTVP
jgi:secreted trypsin-like serine protease